MTKQNAVFPENATPPPIPPELTYQRRLDPLRDTLGLRSFLEKSVNNAAFGLLITQDDSASVDDPRIVTLPLSTFMLLR